MLSSEPSPDTTSDSDYESLPSASFTGSDYRSFPSTPCNNGLANASSDYDDKSPSHEMSHGSACAHFFTSVFDGSESSSHALEYVLNHVFFPVSHSKESDSTPENRHALTSAVQAAVHAYNSHIDPVHKLCWLRVIKTLENLLVVSRYINDSDLPWDDLSREREAVYKDHVISQLGEMRVGGRFRFVMFLASVLRVDRYPCISFGRTYGYISEAGSPYSVRSAHRREFCCTQASQLIPSARFRNT